MKYRSLCISFSIILLSVVLSIAILSRTFKYPYPNAQISLFDNYVMMDLTGVLFGARRLSADIAWVQLLQYYGTAEEPVDKEEEYKVSWEMVKYLIGMNASVPHSHSHKHEHHDNQNDGHEYPDLLKYCRRVVQLDPFFQYAYLYGAGALAWNENRPHESVMLLQEGINAMENYEYNITKDNNQPFWQLHLYMAAIIYRKSGEFDKMLTNLEVAVHQPNCPNIIKAILANIYDKQKKYSYALKLWIEIYDSSDPTYRQKSETKIDELRKLLNM